MAFNDKTSSDHRTGSLAAAPRMGAGNVASYQISPDPFFRMVQLKNGELRRLSFNRVTRYVEVHNHTSGTVCRVGVTENGVADTAGQRAYYDLSGSIQMSANGTPVPQKFGPHEMRTRVIYFSASVGDNIDLSVFAGLTTIPASSWITLTGSNTSVQGVG